ncbi:MAG: hypothetical protein AAGE94_18585 [Acidobacteriota bacterium]
MAELPACPDLEELAAWIDGRVEASTRRRLAAHVGDCARCAELVDTELAFREEAVLDEERVDTSGSEDHTVTPIDSSPPVAADGRPSGRWLGAWAGTLALLVVLVGVGQWDRHTEQTRLERALLDLREHAPRDGSDGLTAVELPVARSCREYLNRTGRGVEPRLLVDCLELIARDADQASLVVVDAPAMAAWLASPEPVGSASCGLLEAAWGALTKTRQDAWRHELEACRQRGAGSPIDAPRDP